MKKFFQKLKSDYKFKQAGPGTKLGEASQQRPQQQQRQPQQQSRSHGMSAAQAQAAAAALERIEKSSGTLVSEAIFYISNYN